MEEKSINLLWMYPDMLNLHGDRGNILALGRVAERMGITLNITKVERFNEKIDFEKADLVFFNPGELKVSLKVLDRLKVDIREVEKYIAANKYVIAIGTTGCIFGKEIEKLADRFVEAGQVATFASDAHTLPKRESRMHDAYEKLEKTQGLDVANSFKQNARNIINSDNVNLNWKPLKKKKRFWIF